MTAYVIYQADVLDNDRYDQYRAEAAPAVAAHGGTYLVRGGEVDVLEGDPPRGRTVVVAFESMEAARRWYDSERYQHAKTLRDGAVEASAYIVAGVD